jgi:ABC-type polar amino acid transport system ATPase subunit
MKLSIRNLWRTHPGAKEPVLKGLSFELPTGTLVAVLGKSGAGKSTMLRCVMGLEPFERGEVELDGVIVRGTEEATKRDREVQIGKLRERMGMVFQSFELFPHLTALENCALAPVKVRGLSRAAAEERSIGLLKQLGLGDKTTHHPDQLSGGQKQRVAIARALAMEPSILMYDEPTSALDPSLKNEVLQTLHRVDATNVTQVVVTHDLQLARGAEWVIVLANGQVIESGVPSKVLVTPEHESTRMLLAHWA